MNYSLPKTVTNCGEELEIRYDYRVILDIMEVLNDPELSNGDKAEAVINIFYVHPEDIKDAMEAIKECFKFIDAGQEQKKKKGAKLVDWAQDFQYIVSPINRVIGTEIREIPYDAERNEGGLHWWTFMSAYMEIGTECLFSQIVNIRDKKSRGKKLEKYESEWYRRNADIVNIKTHYSESEEAFFKEWGGKRG